MAVQTQDDGFHEIQLNGKQLVFLFMAATVVSVVIFLCGVLVGRGVRAERAGGVDTAPLSPAAETVPQQPAPAAAPTPVGSDPTVAAPPPTVDDLTYFDRLQKSATPTDDLKPAPAKAAPAAAAPVVRPAEKPAEKPVEKAVRPAPKVAAAVPEIASAGDTSEPSGQGFAVQVAALNIRGEADAIAKRLSTKGYAAYVLAPATGTPQVFRVRVGKFGTRREAESVAARLQKDEQFKPWITR